jgi:hypothetical protein
MNYIVALISIFNSQGFKPLAIEDVISAFNPDHEQNKPPHT